MICENHSQGRKLKNYRRFRKLIAEWVDLSVKIGKMRKKLSAR